MALLLGKGTAVEWLRSNNDLSPLANTWGLPPSSLEASRTRLERHITQLGKLTAPYQVIVSTKDDCRRNALISSHLVTALDDHYQAHRISRGLYVSTAPCAFLQMANDLDDDQLLFLGHELCGRYGISSDGAFPRAQTCTPQALVAAAESLPPIRGKRRALRVVPQVLGGAASPMEVALALMLHMPCATGGYGLAAPELNRSLLVEGRARDLWVDDHITPDLLWESKGLVIEYDSDLHHSASSRIANDARRRDVLVEMGYRVITVTSEHMRSYHEIDRIAGIVAQTLGSSVTACNQDELDMRTRYQARVRHLATHPEELLALSQMSKKRTWTPRSHADTSSNA